MYPKAKKTRTVGLSTEAQVEVLEGFPANLKRSYENVIHKKVHNSDFVVGIPKGKKVYAFFTFERGTERPVCYFLYLLREGEGRDPIDRVRFPFFSGVRVVNAAFDPQLCFGTILYGTSFYHKNVNCFSIEDVFQHKGRFIDRKNWNEKNTLVDQLLKAVRPVAYNPSFVLFGTPVRCSSLALFEDALASKMFSYPLEQIQFHLGTRINNFLALSFFDFQRDKRKWVAHVPTRNALPNPDRVFAVRADECNDIYHLYCKDDQYYAVALIPDYKTSVEMNRLFRFIKENANLDALEESDDEEEFQNASSTKFVDLTKKVNMLCKFNTKFRKWVPVRVAQEEDGCLTELETVGNVGVEVVGGGMKRKG